MTWRQLVVGTFAMGCVLGTARAQGAGADGADNKDTAAKTETVSALAAATTVPQFLARRGGSLGIPGATARDGLQAAIDVLNSEKVANGFVSLDGTEITDQLQISVVTETFEESVPRAVLGTATVAVEVYGAKLASVGARAKWTSRRLFRFSTFQSRECLAALTKLSADEFAALLGQRESKVASNVQNMNDARTNCKVDGLLGRSGYVLSGGLRVLRRTAAQDEGELADGLAAEAAYMREVSNASRLTSYYVSPSFIWLQRRSEMLADATILYPQVLEVRLSAGIELRGMKLQSYNAAPRLGLYGTASWNWWHNENNFGTVASDIRGSQFEGGAYFSARAGGGLHGLISLSVLKPFGNKDDAQVLLSFSQSVSSNGSVSPAATGGGQ